MRTSKSQNNSTGWCTQKNEHKPNQCTPTLSESNQLDGVLVSWNPLVKLAKATRGASTACEKKILFVISSRINWHKFSLVTGMFMSSRILSSSSVFSFRPTQMLRASATTRCPIDVAGNACRNGHRPALSDATAWVESHTDSGQMNKHCHYTLVEGIVWSFCLSIINLYI